MIGQKLIGGLSRKAVGDKAWERAAAWESVPPTSKGGSGSLSSLPTGRREKANSESAAEP